jgi:hypothetical protein
MVATLLLLPPTAWAHHSLLAEFDSAKTVTLKGTVTGLDWTNPHIWIHVDAKDENGVAGVWKCEGTSTTSLRRQGWTRDSLKIGETVSIEGLRAKNGTNTCNARRVTNSQGKPVFSGSANAQ